MNATVTTSWSSSAGTDAIASASNCCAGEPDTASIGNGSRGGPNGSRCAIPIPEPPRMMKYASTRSPRTTVRRSVSLETISTSSYMVSKKSRGSAAALAAFFPPALPATAGFAASAGLPATAAFAASAGFPAATAFPASAGFSATAGCAAPLAATAPPATFSDSAFFLASPRFFCCASIAAREIRTGANARSTTKRSSVLPSAASVSESPSPSKVITSPAMRT